MSINAYWVQRGVDGEAMQCHDSKQMNDKNYVSHPAHNVQFSMSNNKHAEEITGGQYIFISFP